ncbi:TolC family protein [Chitinophaga qingshengii]|uniref:TolC family protein n=1 Tax=Chitinophaga qingshengii TaxID=1569794 RepID=A0ABR7TTP1_9BACT|nr:TolC family protein [Chitinophaga qingshengii]MBC9933844.1 TolC family protein [Chitinophaga qingshengii]
MTFSRRFVTLLCLSFWTYYNNPLIAQDSTQSTLPAIWSLQDCLDYAMKNNIQLNSLRLSRMSSEQNLLLSKAARLPNLTGSASMNLTGRKTLTAGGNMPYEGALSGNYAVNSGVTLYQGGYLNYDIKQKGLLTQVADLNVAQEINNITILITQAYLNILLARENIVYVRDLVTTSTAQVQQAQQRYDVGSIALKDLASLQSQLAADRYNLVTAENQSRLNKLTLKQLLQLPGAYDFDIFSPDTLVSSHLVVPLQDAQDTALANRPEIKSAELGVNVSSLDLAKARAGFWPTLTAGGALGSSYLKDPGANFFKQLDNNFYQQIGLTLSVPIFTRRANKTNVELSKIEVDQSKLTLKDTRTNLSQTVEQAYINVLNAQGQYDASVEQLRYASESYRIATEQLKVGVANMVDFLQQKNLYVQAFQAYIQAKYNAALTIRIYDFYRGVPVKL